MDAIHSILEQVRANVAKSNTIKTSRWEQVGTMVYGYDRFDNLMVCMTLEDFSELFAEG